jgi:ABC-type uncharacterized transport system auxiliary subunit
MTRTHLPAAGLLAILAAALLAACAQPPVTQDAFYRLQVAPPTATLAKPKLPGPLEVPRFSADGLMAGRPIVFSEAGEPLQLSAYHYHFWLEPPGAMLRDEMVAYLRAAGVAKSVVTPELRVDPDFVLIVKIKRIEQVRGPAPKVVIALEVGLGGRKDDRLLLLKTYRVEKEAANNTVGAAVEAFSGAMAAVCAGVASDIPAL